MIDRRAPWWPWACTAASFLLGAFEIAAPLLGPSSWWSRLPHLLLGGILLANAGTLFAGARRNPRRRGKKRSLPPL
ncbi:hypothetical protein ACIQVK_05460 [Streptomyces sp. NPDC090493]|uniref:hypothetical protein n=1 Tax=Streptomyces sp. NPDC090493 TaxID=3365964 RepID=UPI00381AACDD